MGSRGATDLFAYDEAGHLAGTYTSRGGVVEETVWLGDLPVAILAQGEELYVAPDHLGAPHQITNASSKVVWQWDHDPFGNGEPTGSFTYNLRFPGQFFDQKAALHYNYFRDYDPKTGRYVESDPIGLAGGVGTYGYVGGNPLSAIDPLGAFCLSVFINSFTQNFMSANESFANSSLGQVLQFASGLPLGILLKKGPAVAGATGYTSPFDVLQYLYYSRNLGLQRALASLESELISGAKNLGVGNIVGSLSFRVGLEAGFGLVDFGLAIVEASQVDSTDCSCK